MCLDTVNLKAKKIPHTEVINAYKVFETAKGQPEKYQFPFYSKYPVRRGVWMKAKGVAAFGEKDAVRYRLGFHTLATLKDAKAYAKSLSKWTLYEFQPVVIFEVKLRKVCAMGKQDGCNVIVAKEMFLDRKAKPLPR